MKKALAIVLSLLMLFALPVVYALEAGLLALPEQYCPKDQQFYPPTTEFYDFYYNCGDGTHKYTCGYYLYCGGCGDFIGIYETYDEPDGTPHSYGADGYCYCGAWDGVTETVP